MMVCGDRRSLYPVLLDVLALEDGLNTQKLTLKAIIY